MVDFLQKWSMGVCLIDIAELLAKLSEKYVIVKAWPGYMEDGNLCYDKFDGTESIRISAERFTLWNVD